MERDTHSQLAFHGAFAINRTTMQLGSQGH